MTGMIEAAGGGGGCCSSRVCLAGVPRFLAHVEAEFPVYFQRCMFILGDWGAVCHYVLGLYPSVKCFFALEMLVCSCLFDHFVVT